VPKAPLRVQIQLRDIEFTHKRSRRVFHDYLLRRHYMSQPGRGCSRACRLGRRVRNLL